MPFDPLYLFVPALTLLMAIRLRALLMYFQQEEYDNVRFLRWVPDRRAFDRRASFVLLLSLVCGGALASGSLSEFETDSLDLIPAVLFVAGVLVGTARSRSLMRASKKPLVMTQRARRIYQVALVLGVGLIGASAAIAMTASTGSIVSVDLSALDYAAYERNWQPVAFTAFALVIVQILPLLLIAANMILAPLEERVKAGFRQEAKDKLAHLQPKVIAITGSFGKTSTKHILGHILANAAPTLITPGSVNTDMGITRVIREKLTQDHKYFVVEMGAYGPGSISRLCGLTPPHVALITAVGAAHYERFKTLETVAEAKFEMAESVFRQGGKAIVSSDGIPAHLLADRMKVVQGDYIVVGSEGEIKISDIRESATGLAFTLHLDGEEDQHLEMPLFGRHMVSNAALACVTAREAGLPWSIIRAGLKTAPQVKHRLEVHRDPNGPTIIDDAYNSNPVGFASALDALNLVVADGCRRIVITPGMVEMGTAHDQSHAELGALAAAKADIIAVVTPERIPTFVDAAEQQGGARVLKFAKQADAEDWARGEWKKGDAVLFENNLPDLFDTRVVF